tara:strand:+ start:68 stop:1897 length:1830 start_codon:yes stop_codon:yes gene_type:complete
MSRFAGRRSGGGDSSTLIIIVMMMMMMSFVFIIVGGGWFYNKSTDGGIIGVVCNDDKNAEYELDNQLKCKFVKCKDGYTADSTGTCVGGKDTNLSVTSGEENISVDCEIDEITPYTFGQCLNTVTGEPLSGDIDNCGTGRQRKTPNVKTVQIGREGSCPEQTHAECIVACPLECKAPDELWAPDDGAVCMAGTRKLGVTVDVGGGTLVTYCGEGTQIKKLDGERITSSMMGGMDLEAYKNSINFNVCTSPTSKPCKVECTNATQPVSCPISNYDIGWLYEGGGSGTVYTKESAEGLLRGDINSSQLELEPAVSRQDAIDSGAFVSATGAVNNDLIPKGYKIKFKASNEYSTAWLREQGCSIFVLEEAQAPRTSEACTWTELPGACYDVGCGTLQQKTVDHNIALQAWGNGSCDKPREFTQPCTTRTTPCCDERYVGAWTEVEGYDGCVEDVDGQYRRQSTRPGNAACSNSNTKLGALCSYDCKLESLEMEYKGTMTSSGYPGCKGKYNKKDLTSISLRAAKGGTACPEININDTFQSSDQVNAKLEGVDFSAVSVPDFKCGSWLRGGQCGVSNMNYDTGTCVNGNNCGEGDNFSGQVGWYRKPSFQMNC